MSGKPRRVHNLYAAVHQDRVRVETTADGSVLPRLEVERWPTAQQILAGTGTAPAWIMAPATLVAADPRVLLHLVAVPDHEPDVPTLGLDDLGRLSSPRDVEPSRDAIVAAVRRGVAEYRGEVGFPADRPAWFRPDWLRQVDAWVDDRLAGAGLRRTGPSEPIKLWSLSAVLRVPVDGSDGAVFFKAACELFRAEPVLTEVLHRVVPHAVPDPLAVDAEQPWMLMRPFPSLTEPDESLGPDAARTLADVQLAMVDHLDDMRAAGAVDRTVQPTLDALDEMVEGSLELGLLTVEERTTSRAMLPWLRQEVTALAATGMPFTIGHGDMHIGNVTLTGDGPLLYDWTDAAVTFPVLDVVLLGSSVGEHREATVAAYRQAWLDARPGVDIDGALRHASTVNAVYQAISYEGIYRHQEERTRWEMGGVVAGTLRDLGQRWRQR